MSGSRWLYKVDKNQLEIVQALRQRGATVCDIHGVGHGCPDLLVGFMGHNILMEVKSDPRAKLTDGEAKWHEEWRGVVHIAYNPEQSISILEDLIDD